MAVAFPIPGPQVRPLEFDWQLGFTNPMTKLARDYWLSRRRSCGMPTRADLSPIEMRRFLAHVGLVEVRSTGGTFEYVIRHAGTQWERVFGPMTGRALHQFLPQYIEERWHSVFDAVREAARPLRVTTHIAFEDKNWLATEMFVGPLGSGPGAVCMLLMCFTAWSDPTA